MGTILKIGTKIVQITNKKIWNKKDIIFYLKSSIIIFPSSFIRCVTTAYWTPKPKCIKHWISQDRRFWIGPRRIWNDERIDSCTVWYNTGFLTSNPWFTVYVNFLHNCWWWNRRSKASVLVASVNARTPLLLHIVSTNWTEVLWIGHHRIVQNYLFILRGRI